MTIKVCGMRDADNIAEVGRLEPDMMGFIFYERSPRFAGAMAPGALDPLPPCTKRVGVFVDAPPDVILETVRRYALDLVQLHGAETPELCAALRPRVGVIKAFGIASADDLCRTAAWEGACDYFLFDTAAPTHGGTGRKFDHSLLADYRGATPFLLSGGLGPEDAPALAEAFAETATMPHPLCAGVDINSRFETAPGVKNPEAIKTFIQKLKQQ
jgi:phosphoribosylanthranilate isomerase